MVSGGTAWIKDNVCVCVCVCVLLLVFRVVSGGTARGLKIDNVCVCVCC